MQYNLKFRPTNSKNRKLIYSTKYDFWNEMKWNQKQKEEENVNRYEADLSYLFEIPIPKSVILLLFSWKNEYASSFSVVFFFLLFSIKQSRSVMTNKNLKNKQIDKISLGLLRLFVCAVALLTFFVCCNKQKKWTGPL